MKAKMETHATNLTCPECRGPISESRKGPSPNFTAVSGIRIRLKLFLPRMLRRGALPLGGRRRPRRGRRGRARTASRHSSAVKRRLEQEAGENNNAARTIRELLALLTRENSQNLMEDAT